MSVWTHAICLPCWVLMNPGRDPVTLKPEYVGTETCCFCGKSTNAGIYVRHDPAETRCRGEHGEEAP